LLTLALCQGGHRGLDDGSRTGRAALPNNAKTDALDALPLIGGMQKFVQQATRWGRRQWGTDGCPEHQGRKPVTRLIIARQVFKFPTGCIALPGALPGQMITQAKPEPGFFALSFRRLAQRHCATAKKSDSIRYLVIGDGLQLLKKSAAGPEYEGIDSGAEDLSALPGE
jgi:hypothetical protein